MAPPELATAGRLTAGIGHELRNVLAIVSEYAGLIEDVLGSGGVRAGKHGDRLARSLAAIQRQVGRGNEILGHLSRLAHTLDRPETGVEPAELVALVVSLLSREARLHRVSVAAEPGPAGGALTGLHPGRLVLAVCDCLYSCLPRVGEGGVLTVAPAREGGRAVVRVERRSAADSAPPRPDDAALGDRLADLGIALRETETGFDLLLPLSPAAG